MAVLVDCLLMRRALLLVCSLFASVPARAMWGPFAGVTRVDLRRGGPGVLDGWCAGLAAFGPRGEGFWQWAGGRARTPAGDVRLEWAEARLNFRLVGGRVGMLYGGPSGALDWLRRAGGRERRFVAGAQGGLLLDPSGIFGWAPGGGLCWSCVFAPNGQDCAACRQRQAYAAATVPTAGTAGSGGPIFVGAEAGWRQAKSPYGGPEYRAFMVLAF